MEEGAEYCPACGERAAPAAPVQDAGEKSAKDDAQLGLILGIVGRVFLFAPPIGITLGIIAVYLGNKSMKKGGDSTAKLALIFGIIALILSAAFLAFLVTLVMSRSKPLPAHRAGLLSAIASNPR